MSGTIFHPFVLDNAAGQETVVGIGSDQEKYGVGISSDIIVTGSMGVGTTLPSQKLDVHGGISAYTDANNFIVLNPSDGSIELKRAGGPFIDFADSGGDDHDCRIKQESNDLAFTTGGNGSATEKLRIRGDGQVVYTPMTTTQRDALTAQEGGVIYNSTANKLQVYNGSAWGDLH